MTIVIENLSKSYGDKEVLKNINLTIEENKIYGLLGRNGAGKTTLLNLITDRIFKDEGRIYLETENSKNEDFFSDIYLTSERTLYPEKEKAKDIFKWTKYFYENFDMGYALELAKKFDLNINKKIKDLSTGYTSIVKIITSLASRASILIFDEPVLGLDAHHRELFYKELILNYIDEPKTIIISTHIIEEVSDVLEKVIIIDDGKIIKDEYVEDLKKNAYSVSGSEVNVNEYIKDKNCVYLEGISGYSSATIIKEKEIDKDELKRLNLNIGTVELQKLFIHLTMKGEK